MPPPIESVPVAVPFHFFEIGFAPNAWRVGLLAASATCAVVALLARRRAPATSRLAWGMAASLLAGGLAFEAFLAWFPHDRWSGVFFVLGAPLAAGLGIGLLAGRSGAEPPESATS
jgi:hypothetical protein